MVTRLCARDKIVVSHVELTVSVRHGQRRSSAIGWLGRLAMSGGLPVFPYVLGSQLRLPVVGTRGENQVRYRLELIPQALPSLPVTALVMLGRYADKLDVEHRAKPFPNLYRRQFLGSF